jgi:hypothetical protein
LRSQRTGIEQHGPRALAPDRFDLQRLRDATPRQQSIQQDGERGPVGCFE